MEKNYRKKTCNFCDFAECCGIPEGVLCKEEHHQEGKDKFQCYCSPGCKYFKEDEKNDVYDLEYQSRKWELELKQDRVEKRQNLIEKMEKELEELKRKQKEDTE